jgi:hypothetical protein
MDKPSEPIHGPAEPIHGVPLCLPERPTPPMLLPEHPLEGPLTGSATAARAPLDPSSSPDPTLPHKHHRIRALPHRIHRRCTSTSSRGGGHGEEGHYHG